MKTIVRFGATDLLKITKQRSGEIKFGERIVTVPKDADTFEFIKNAEAQFVLLGIPEDIGVRANYGRPGAATAWHRALRDIANIQHNRFCKGSNLIILGHIDVQEYQDAAEKLDAATKEGRKELSLLVEKLDKEVSHIVCKIIQSGKVPIIIGGGHNNAYGNIKGTALAKGKPINAISFDAHPNFRMLEGRHSNNGFSYAFEEGFLKNYFIFGMHENYATKGVMEAIKKYDTRIRYNTYEQIMVRKEKYFSEEMAFASAFTATETFGLELDLDALPHVASSAMTPTGFSIEKARQFVHYFGKSKNVAYLHLCEGAPSLDNENNSHMVGKLIAAFVSDFMKAKEV